MSDESSRAAQLDALQNALAGVWSIERELGRGGMGTVYLARDVALDRPVAIKVLDPELTEDVEQHDRFLSEARTGARLSHPHIVPIYAVEEAAGSVYIVMGLVDGESLRERILLGGPLDSAETLRILREIAWALGYAHAMGTLHRDVTLDNILIDRRTGRAMLADFGIAAEVNREDAGPLIGTPAYLAPELIQGKPAAPSSDLYALGITGWAMLAGRLPFQGEDNAAVLLQQLTEEMPSLAGAAPGASARLVRAIEACLVKEPTARPQTMEAWLATFEGKSNEVVLAGPLGTWVDQWRHVKAFYALAMSVIVMLAGISGSFGPIFFGYSFPWLVIAIPLSLAWLVHRAVDWRALRSVAQAGYGIEDLRTGLRRKFSSSHRSAGTERPGWFTRLVRALPKYSFFIFLLINLCWILLVMAIEKEYTLHRHGPWPWYFKLNDERLLSWLLQGSVLTFWSSLSLNIMLPGAPSRFSKWRAKRRLAFWNSRRGEAAFSLASQGISSTTAPDKTLHRPTELVLDLAIEDLWQALPGSARGNVGEVPSLARSLRKRVADLKEMIVALDLPSIKHTPEVAGVLARLQERQEAGVTALERIRLMLCELGRVTKHDSVFTEQLQDLRAVEAELLKELGGHSDLLRLLKRDNVSPLPTPA